MTKIQIIKELKRIRKNAEFQSYGRNELDDDLDWLITKLKEPTK